MVDMVKNSQKKYGRLILVIVNILLILAAVFSSLIYSGRCLLFHDRGNEAGFCQIAGDGEGVCSELGGLHRKSEYDNG